MSDRVEYYRESIEISANDYNIPLTPEQIEHIANGIVGCVENEGTAFGRDAIPNPLEARVDQMRDNHSKEIREADERVRQLQKQHEDTVWRLSRRISDLQDELREARKL